MANRGQSAEKRRLDKLRQDQQAAKRERRHSREASEPVEAGGPSEEELFERFRLLNEAHAAGTVSDEDFGPARHAIMVALGLEEPVPPPDEDDA